MTTYRIFLKGSDGKTYTTTYANLKRDLGILVLEMHRDTLFRRVNELEGELISIYEDGERAKILELLRANPDMRTRAITDKCPRERLKSLAFQSAFAKLSENGEIIGTSHEQGYNRTWRIKEQ